MGISAPFGGANLPSRVQDKCASARAFETQYDRSPSKTAIALPFARICEAIACLSSRRGADLGSGNSSARLAHSTNALFGKYLQILHHFFPIDALRLLERPMGVQSK